ncbi:sugar phosphate isomerase/epimerase [Poseidonocella sp. HB161398]|uniref:sugar phosphate isomerase/epimerase family protein n=1 Tax=Poseidonocella sp. HB161398 TaxID=2320855 RepID=UPI0011086F3E|nr:sugar phosphate isomerase/epimerase [Poseidonocella sp. HB161398]
MTGFAPDRLLGSNFGFQHVPFGLFLDTMAASGIARIELWGIAPHLDIERAGPARIARLARELEAAGLSLHCLTPEQVAYPVNPASPDPDLRAASRAHFRKAARIAADLGARNLFATCGRGDETAPPEEAAARAAAELRDLAGHADGLGLRLLLEPLQRRESNIVNTAAELGAMLAAIGHPGIDAVLDLVAMEAAGDTVADYTAHFGPRLAHVHIADGTPAGHLAWGDGTLPLGRHLGALAAAGYAGSFAFEPFGDGRYASDPVAAWAQNLAGFAPWTDTAKEPA